MSVIGIDLSLAATGLAAYSRDGEAETKIVKSKGKRGDCIAARSDRIYTIAGDIDEWMLFLNPSLVVVEGPAFGIRGGSMWDRAGLWWRVITTMLNNGEAVASCSPATLKKWATGRGDADKAAVAAAIARRTTVDLASADAVDAMALAMLGAHKLGWIEGPAYAVEQLAKVEWPEVMAP